MLAYAPHDVVISGGPRELSPEDGWRCFESTIWATLACTCGHRDGPMPKPLAMMFAKLHVHGAA